VIALVHTLAGLVLGALSGFLIQMVTAWPGAPAILAACGAAGQVCRAMLGYFGRPSGGTHAYQLGLTLPGVAASFIVGLSSIVILLQFPATIVAPAASYLLVRVLLSWQHGKQASIDRRGLWVAARGGEILTLLAALLPLS
jgi:hypothetical protein